MRGTIPAENGGVVHLFVVYGYQGAEENSDKLLLVDKLLSGELAEAQVVCVEQPVLLVGDFDADPGVTIFAEIITDLTRYRPIVLELI